MEELQTGHIFNKTTLSKLIQISQSEISMFLELIGIRRELYIGLKKKNAE